VKAEWDKSGKLNRPTTTEITAATEIFIRRKNTIRIISSNIRAATPAMCCGRNEMGKIRHARATVKLFYGETETIEAAGIIRPLRIGEICRAGRENIRLQGPPIGIE